MKDQYVIFIILTLAFVSFRKCESGVRRLAEIAKGNNNNR